MTEEEKLRAYERMKADVEEEYAGAAEKMERLKTEGKTKTVSFKTLMGRKLFLREVLELYGRYGL